MDDKTNKKRSRSSNWTESEKALLTELIKEKYDLVENKDVTRNTNQLKKMAWQEILQSFNEMNDTKRDLPQLMNQWRNTKNIMRKSNSEYQEQENCNCGRPRPPSSTPEDVEFMEMPKKFKTDRQSDSDSDSDDTEEHPPKEVEVVITNPFEYSNLLPTEKVQMPIVELNEEAKVPSIKKFNNNTNKKKAKVSLEPPTRYSEELFALAKSVREQQLKHQKEEHELRMKIMVEEHERRVKIMQKEFEYWEKKLYQTN